jgi:hypothetical protein
VIVVEKGEQPYFLTDPRLTPWQNLTSEFASASVVKNVFYPFDVAQSLMQINSPDAKEGVIPTLVHLKKTYGISSWFRGNIVSNISSAILTLGGFCSRKMLKNYDAPFSTVLTVVHAEAMMVALYPLQVIKVKMITDPAKYQNFVQSLTTVHQEEGLPGLFRGLGFTIFEIIPMMVSNYIGFEIASLIFKKPRGEMTLGENISMAIVCSFIATALHYPFETAKKQVQATKYTPEGDGVIKTLMDTGEKHGMMGLWKGFTANIFKLPSLLIHRSIFHLEQIYFLKMIGIKPPYFHPSIKTLNQL